MDVNGTRFHLILGEADWNRQVDGAMGLAWDGEYMAVGLQPLVFRFPTPPGDRIPSREDRRGAGQDRYGNLYWIDESRAAIRFLPRRGGQAQHFWSSLDPDKTPEHNEQTGDFESVVKMVPRPLVLSGLAVTEHHYLVVGVVEPADQVGVLIFDLHAGGRPIQMIWPEGIPFEPFDMAPASGGGVWILDEEARYWALDRYFRVISADQWEQSIEPGHESDFQPEGGEPRQRPARTFPTGISLAYASPVEATNIMAIEGLPDGTVLILESDPALPYSVISRYRFARRLGEAIALRQVLPISNSDATLSEKADLMGHDMAFVPDTSSTSKRMSGILYIVAADGNQSFAFTLQADDESWDPKVLPHYLPMRRFSGLGLVAGKQSASYHTLRDSWNKLVALPQPRYRPSATFVAGPFDGKVPDCIWHRLFLDARIPPGAEVAVESRAANSETLLEQTRWEAEPLLYRRHTGSEIPYYQPFSQEEAKQDGTGTWETLLQRARGCYLELRLTLRGTGRNTPRVRALRAYYPRFSYLKEYLPAAYGYDETSAFFLERFLANMEGTFTATEGRIEQVQALFDVDSSAVDYLAWLASWFGVTLDPTWDAQRRRLFLSHAMELFNQRGTVSGLIRAIRLATDPCPDNSLFEEDVVAYQRCQVGTGIPGGQYSVRVVESFLTRSVPGVVFGDPTASIQPQLVSRDAPWTPAQGSSALHANYRQYLRRIYQPTDEYPTGFEALQVAWGESRYTSFEDITFSAVPPSNPAAAADWNRFRETELGFTYAPVTPQDQVIYQDFLARRYRQIKALNEAYQWTDPNHLTSFSQVILPTEDDMPVKGPQLNDWIQFVSLVIPIRRHAHRFTVLIPTDTRGDDLTTLEQRLAAVERIVDIEKPAHTDFEVKPYWALFRVGEARLGLDTLLDQGSRFVALLLGLGYLGESYIAPEEPWNVRDRMVAGRDQLGQRIQV